MHAELRREGAKRGVRVFLGLTTAAILGILIVSAGEYGWRDLFQLNTWRELLERATWQAILFNLGSAFRSINAPYLLLAIAVISIHYYLHCLRLQLLAWATGRFISLASSVEFTFGGLFLGAVTPFQSGGVPLQLYVLKREGLSVGKGGAVIIFRGVLSLSILVVGLPLLFSYRALLGSGEVSAVMRYLFVLYALLLFILFSALFRTEGLRRHAFALANWLRRWRMVRGDGLHKWFARVFEEVTDFKTALRDYFRERKGRVALSFLATLFTMVFYFLLAPILLIGIGVTDVPITQAMALGMAIAYLLPFAPTPGASGIAEVVSSAIFLTVCPKHLLGVYILLWRFLTFYMGVILGAVVILRMLKAGAGPNTSDKHSFPDPEHRRGELR